MRTKYGYFVPSEKPDVIKALEKYCPGKSFVDLGSGDGRVWNWAKELGAKVKGYEIDPEICEHREEVENCDFLEKDLSSYDVAFYYKRGSHKETHLFYKIRKEFSGIFIVNMRYCWKDRPNLSGWLGRKAKEKIGECLIYEMEKK